jgi:NAD(P)-dependent dehydrogenase (short-subunit alcohol dehydrogenase family)
MMVPVAVLEGCMRLAGKTALVTGGSSGIGLATAAAFAREDARVTITGRDRGRLDAAVSRLGAGAAGFVADIDDDDAMAAAMRAAAEPSGGLDIVFANAGGYVDAHLGSTTRADLEQQFADITGIFMTVQHALPHLRDGASVIVMGSLVRMERARRRPRRWRARWHRNWRRAVSASMWSCPAQSTRRAGRWPGWSRKQPPP